MIILKLHLLIIFYIIWLKNYFPIVLKDANTNYNYSYNGKAILYYEDVNKPAYQFYFFKNRDYKRILLFSSLVRLGWWSSYIHSDDINK